MHEKDYSKKKLESLQRLNIAYCICGLYFSVFPLAVMVITDDVGKTIDIIINNPAASIIFIPFLLAWILVARSIQEYIVIRKLLKNKEYDD